MSTVLLFNSSDKLSKASEPQLLQLLLLLLSDETASDVAAEARTQAQAAGRAWVARQKPRDEQRRLAHLRAEGWSSDSGEMDGAEPEEEDGALLCMVRSLFLESLLPRALEDVGHWTLRVRHRAILLLATLVSLGGPEPVTAALPCVVRTLLSTLVADGAEAEVDAAVGQAARALGRIVALGALLDELLPQVRERRVFCLCAPLAPHPFSSTMPLQTQTLQIGARRAGRPDFAPGGGLADPSHGPGRGRGDRPP